MLVTKISLEKAKNEIIQVSIFNTLIFLFLTILHVKHHIFLYTNFNKPFKNR